MSSCPVKSKVPFLLLLDHVAIGSFQQAHIHLSNSSGNCRVSPCSHQQLSALRATSPSNHLPTSGPLMAVLAKWGGRESIAVVPRGCQRCHCMHPKSLFIQQKRWGWHSMAMWCVQPVVPSSNELIYGFIVEKDPISTILIHVLAPSAAVPIQSPWRQLESFSFPMPSSTDPSVLTQADLPLSSRCIHYLYFGMDII